MRLEERLGEWKGFRRALRIEERFAFDEVQQSVRSRAAAGGMLLSPDPMEPILLSILVEAYLRLRQAEQRIDDLEEEMRGRVARLGA
jgi:hypothetical protein